MFAYNLTLQQQEEPKRLYGPFPLEIPARGVFPVSPANGGAGRSQKRSVSKKCEAFYASTHSKHRTNKLSSRKWITGGQ